MVLPFVVATGSSGRLLEVTKFLSGLPDPRTDGVVHLDVEGLVGFMAFFVPPDGSRPLLLVTNYSRDAVRVCDVVSKTFKKDLVPRGRLKVPYGIAAQMGLRGPSSMVAVSHPNNWVSLLSYSSADRTWNVTREIALSYFYGSGLRFVAGGTQLCVANFSNHQGSLAVVGIEDGQVVHNIRTETAEAVDVEEVEGGWLVAAYGSPCLRFVKADGSGHAIALQGHVRGGAFSVPGFGIAVRHKDRVTVYERSSALAMRRMAPARVARMVAVVKQNL